MFLAKHDVGRKVVDLVIDGACADAVKAWSRECAELAQACPYDGLRTSENKCALCLEAKLRARNLLHHGIPSDDIERELVRKLSAYVTGGKAA
ncbi:MAG: hypothetical protein HQL36_05830 [Alphaproteobacteria bacterium]|nr:hypothetical protein [Alphaproteobacteria bacterium]